MSRTAFTSTNGQESATFVQKREREENGDVGAIELTFVSDGVSRTETFVNPPAGMLWKTCAKAEKFLRGGSTAKTVHLFREQARFTATLYGAIADMLEKAIAAEGEKSVDDEVAAEEGDDNVDEKGNDNAVANEGDDNAVETSEYVD